AQNHQPDTEGSWSDRKQVAVQAYLEWMPVRDPEAGKAREALWRSFTFGDVATVHALETRLTGRSEEISWSTELNNVAPADVPAKAVEVMGRVNDPSRTMLGEEQEDWLAGELTASVKGGKTWQVLANQIIMARVVPPNLNATLTDEQKAQITNPYVQPLVGFTALQLPFNLDAWDGFPAARERLYASAKTAGARLVTLTGDTHTAWANTLVDGVGERRGVEFGCTSVTSPGLGDLLPFPDLGQQFSDNNSEVDWYDPFGSGYTVLTLTKDDVQAEFLKVDTILQPSESIVSEASFKTSVDGDSLTALEKTS
ncbi:MAG: alkaline phosphatase D family protein, partial [Pseudomonadota bacterium]